MKQNITLEQLNELTEKQKKKLNKWSFEKKYVTSAVSGVSGSTHLEMKYYSFLSIGQMIEFLADGRDYNHMPDMTIQFKEFSSSSLLDYGLLFRFGNEEKKHGELCDKLWEAVKEVLKN